MVIKSVTPLTRMQNLKYIMQHNSLPLIYFLYTSRAYLMKCKKNNFKQDDIYLCMLTLFLSRRLST